jgi:hypothetical protein
VNNKISGLEAPDNVSSKPLIISCYIIITFVLAIIILSLKYFPNSFYIAIGASGLVSAISLHILLYYQNKTYKKLLDTSNNLRALSYIDNTLSILRSIPNTGCLRKESENH